MKTTLELPDDLMQRMKLRAAERNRKLKDVIEEVIRRGLVTTERSEANSLDALKNRLIHNADGTYTNPDGIDDPEFFTELEHIRESNRKEPFHDPFDACH
ncbi:MAG: hypothetical protein EHM62_05410 [Methylococcus sp.]|jgi:plasmid stability protein|nr:MAG: hypothetical protein EHM62_05410 [Methylococcus sp.]